MVGEELFHCADAKVLTTLLSEGLQAETIWSMNGANSVSRKNKYGFGHIGFGGNDLAMDIFQSINENDCVLLLGICPDEYTTNFKQLTAAEVFYVGQAGEVYGLVDHKMTYFIKGNFHAIQGDLSLILNEMVSDIQKGGYTHILASEAPQNLNKENFQAAREGYVDMADFYLQLDELWAENSIAFLDVCLAYKDHQYVIPRPNDHIDFISLYRGSAMGGAFGLAVGAKIGAPEKNVFCFTGDGCFRLFAGTMAEVSDLGIVVFLLNNQTLGIVSQGLRKILPDVIEEGYHSVVKEVDYCGIARSFGWKSFKLNPDLSNLSTIFEEIKPDMKQSVFIELEVDPEQQLGKNPRLANL
ncbi:thiamine pyrophosphate-dependent enzyme [Chryseobacterium tructae]|nr:thiamine pyrophosphate-dependent enzyme [Chryseobacterium tructae]MDN3691792.1 thiamine pyrophosphate-dependent enzyme [Chryseobacterium tructae]